MRSLAFILFLTVSATAFSQKKTRLPEPLNLWDYEEYSPSISADGKTLIFQSERYGVLVSGINRVPEINSEGHKNRTLNRKTASFFGIYQATLHPGGQWSKPEPIDAINRFSEAMTPVVGGPSISYDGNYLFFFANFPDDKSALGKEDLYYSVREKYGWSAPINLGPEINTSGYEGFPSISSDGRHLYFIREDLTKKALGEEQCYRIMRSEKDLNGKWKRPIELAAPVNMDCEKAPRIMADNKTLVFSSIKKGGKGNFDLYISRLNENGTWSEPQALDFVNSKHADQAVAISACGDEMFYISDGDIYTIAIPEALRPQKMMTLQGFVVDAESQAPISTIVILKDKTNGKVIASIETNSADGRYTLLAPQGGKYQVEINDRNYKPASSNHDLTHVNHCEIIKSDFKLEKSQTLSKRDDIFIEETAVVKNTAEIIETEIVSTRRNAPKVVSIVEEERVNLTKDTKVVVDSLQEIHQKAPEIKKTELFTITLLVRDGENNGVVKNVDLQSDNLKYDFDAERNSFDIKVSSTDKYDLLLSAPGYQTEQYSIRDVTASKRVVVQLFAELPSNLNITVTDLTSGNLVASSIEVTTSEGKNYTLDNTSGKTVIEFSRSQKVDLIIHASGYTTLRKQLDIEVIPEGNLYQLDARLEKISYMVYISALDKETRTPVSGANFSLVSGSGQDVSKNAELTGKTQYSIEGTGHYMVTSTAPGYQDQVLDLAVVNNITDVVFEMVKKAVPTKDFVLAFIDEFTKESLNADVKTNKLLVKSNPPTVQIEQGSSAHIEASISGYPVLTADLDYNSVQNQEFKLKRDLYPFRFRIVSETTRRLLDDARVNLVDEKTKEKAQFELHDGIVTALLSPEKNYMISATATGYSNVQLLFETLQALYDNTRERAVFLKPQEVSVAKETIGTQTIETKEFGVIRTGVSVQLNNIYFDQSSPVLKPESNAELDNLASVLFDNANIRIEVRGYTDNQGDFNKNVQLSKDRCQAVIHYLISKGISASRMTAVGRGPLDPIAPNNSEENRSRNRRVEFVVI